MRLWHYQLLPYLDDFHIVAQWRELLSIKGAIDKNGTPNHRLVNKVLKYSIVEFIKYCSLVTRELDKRNIRYDKNKYMDIIYWKCDKFGNAMGTIYDGWHNNRYLTQCYYNLQEKYDCGIVSKQAWARIDEFYKKEMMKSDTSL